MCEKCNRMRIYGFCLAFLILVVYSILKDVVWLPLLVPAVLLTFCIFFFAFDKSLLLITFMVPLSVNIGDGELGLSLGVPDEIFMMIMLFLYVATLLYDKKPDMTILRHPVTIIVILMLLWMFITSLTSSMVIVSLKHTLARMWFVIPFYFVAIRMMTKERGNIEKLNWAYLSAFTIAIVIIILRQYGYGFGSKIPARIYRPFFPEHTCYGAVLAFMLPFLGYYAVNSEYVLRKRLFSAVLLVLYIAAMYLSFTRAAWVSAILSLCVLVCFLLRLRFKYVVVIVAAAVGLFIALQDRIIIKLQQNSTESSQNFADHVKSITNISSDASNLERINRWKSAVRMFHERPVFGWGPGTYQFKYAPFQRSKEKTIISTNAGDVGGSHSEYLGPLSEQGMPGFLLVIAMMIAIFATGAHVYAKSKSKTDRMIAVMCMLAFVTYFSHGLVNSFSDIDKAAAPFWLYVATLVALDVRLKNNSDGD